MKEPKVKKSEQTYAWALAEMQKPARTAGNCTPGTATHRLSDIAKKHHTPELMAAAILNGHADIKDMPPEIMAREMYLHAAILQPQDIGIVPKEVRDFAFLKEVVSNNPEAFGAAWFWFRKDQGRSGPKYTREDIELTMEAICPSLWAEKRLESLCDWAKPVISSEEKEKKLTYIKEFCYNLPPCRAPREMLWLGLNALLAAESPSPGAFSSHDMARKLLSLPDRPLYIAGSLPDGSESIEEWDAYIRECTITHGDGAKTEAILVDIGEVLCHDDVE